MHVITLETETGEQKYYKLIQLSKTLYAYIILQINSINIYIEEQKLSYIVRILSYITLQY